MVKITKNYDVVINRVPMSSLSDDNNMASCCYGGTADVELRQRSLIARFYPYRITL